MRSKTLRACFVRVAAIAATIAASAVSFSQSLELVISEGLREPYGVAVDPQNNYYVLDSANDRIVRFNPETGALSILAGATDQEGFVNARGQAARFRNPEGIVSLPIGGSGVRLPSGEVTVTGFLVADTGNHSIRHVALDGAVSTIVGNGQAGTIDQGRLNAPVGLAIGSDGFVYIADAQNNAIRRYHLLTGDFQNVVNTGLRQPQGVALDEAGNLYISDTGHHAIKIKRPGQGVELLAGGNSPGLNGLVNAPFLLDARFDRPGGLYLAGSRTGLLVADTGNGVVRRLYDLNTTAPKIETYGSDGNSPLLSPVSIARELGGSFLVADPGRNAIYAIRTSQTPQPPVPEPTIGYVVITNLFECTGTYLVAVTNATFNNDVVIAIRGDAQAQTFFVAGPTDQVQDAIPTETPLPYADCQPSLPPSLISPAPDVTIKAYSTQADRRPSAVVTARFRFKVGNPIIQGNNPASLTLASATADAQIYYTVGTPSKPPAEPTQANGRIYQPGTTINLNVRNEPGIIRARAFRGGYAPSETVEKQFDPEAVEYSLLGIQRGFVGGPGASIIVPVNLAPMGGSTIRSYQFRAEVRAVGNIGGTPRAGISLLPGNDFIDFPYANKANEGFGFSTDTSEGVVVAALGNPNDAGITNSATIAMLAVTLPTNAPPGQRYELSIREVSATSDGNQRAVAITNLPNVSLQVANTQFLVGDVAPATWYNAGEFGDGELRNNDVNAAFLASLGLRVPYSISDAFKAMDTYPLDTAFRRGGDNQIRFLDWQTLLVRSVGLDSNNWIRWYGPTGLQQAPTNLPAVAPASSSGSKIQAFSVNAAASATSERIVWSRPARLGALRVPYAVAGSAVRIPVYLAADPAITVSGLQFIAKVQRVLGAPQITGDVAFQAAAGFTPTSTGNTLPGGVMIEDGAYASWNLGGLTATGSNIIGHVRFTIPANAPVGAEYQINLSQTDGSSGATVVTAQQLDFESVPASTLVGTTWLAPEAPLATEWVAEFFGGAWPGAFSDPDGDGLMNFVEFNEGTHPLRNDSQLEMTNAAAQALSGQVALRFYGAGNVKYVLEATANLKETWSAISPVIVGEGRTHTYEYTQATKNAQFFRLRVNP